MTIGRSDSTTAATADARPAARWIYCLALDLIGSTSWGLEQTNAELDDFNLNLHRQAEPHLAELGLRDQTIKFTGDGWLIFAEDELVPCLCAFALIMSTNFRVEMARYTNRPEESIPLLRQAIAAGRDVRVDLFGTRTDWVGDSARNASRLIQYCVKSENEILVMDAVRGLIERDFMLEDIDISARPAPAKPSEARLSACKLRDFKPKISKSKGTHRCYVYALNVIARSDEAQDAARRAAEAGEPLDARSYNVLIRSADDYATALQWLEAMRRESVAADSYTYTILMHRAPDYTRAIQWFDVMKQESIAPNVVTYSTLMNRAPDYSEAVKWLDLMRHERIAPNVFTFSTLMQRAADYDTAVRWLETMRREGVSPNVVTFNTLIGRAPSYEQAEEWLAVMRREEIRPDVVTFSALVERSPNYGTARVWVERLEDEGFTAKVTTYNSLFHKRLTGVTAEDLLTWYRARRFHPESPVQAAIASYVSSKETEEAFRLALDYAHLPAARKLIRRNPQAALTYFGDEYAKNPNHPNAAYALGITSMELGDRGRAKEYLQVALDHATANARRAVIREWLRQLSEVDRQAGLS